MSKKYKNKSLSERISEKLIGNLNDSEDTTSENEEAPKVTRLDGDDYDFGNEETIKSLSEIRKRNVKLLSEQSSKYSGVIASRKDYVSTDDDNEDCSNSKTSALEDSDNIVDFNESNSEAESEAEGDSDVYDESNKDLDEEEIENELVSIKNNKLEVEKGICVQNQLSIWEKLLEIRIHSQKMLNKANSLPDPNLFNKLSNEREFKDVAQDVQKNTEVLLEKLIETQVTLANQFSEIKKIGLSTRKRANSRSNDDNDSSSEPSKKFARSIEDNFGKFRPYRNTVLLKWEDRTNLLGPSSGGAKRKQFADEFDIVRKIDNILMKREEHIAKSQKVKGTYKIFGQVLETENNLNKDTENEEENSSTHIYDDTDFYHSQLRELIEFKSNVSSEAYDVTKQFAELQKLRQKMKKKVDTRASKGRKIRYVVHNKLVNFMAPNDTSDWTDESRNELYRSLFVT